MGLDVSIIDEQDCIIINLSGKIDISSHDRLLKVLYQVLSSQKNQIIIDMSQVSFISSNGIGTIMEARNFIVGQKGQFILTGLNSKIHSVFELIGVLDQISVCETVDTAMSALNYKISLKQSHS